MPPKYRIAQIMGFLREKRLNNLRRICKLTYVAYKMPPQDYHAFRLGGLLGANYILLSYKTAVSKINAGDALTDQADDLVIDGIG